MLCLLKCLHGVVKLQRNSKGNRGCAFGERGVRLKGWGKLQSSREGSCMGAGDARLRRNACIAWLLDRNKEAKEFIWLKKIDEREGQALSPCSLHCPHAACSPVGYEPFSFGSRVKEADGTEGDVGNPAGVGEGGKGERCLPYLWAASRLITRWPRNRLTPQPRSPATRSTAPRPHIYSRLCPRRRRTH